MVARETLGKTRSSPVTLARSTSQPDSAVLQNLHVAELGSLKSFAKVDVPSNSSVAIAYESTIESDNLDLVESVSVASQDTHELGVWLCTVSECRCPSASKSLSSPRRFASSAARLCRPIACCPRGAAIPTSTRGWCRSTRSRLGCSASRQRIKYVRTIVNELTYLPLLVREIARADVVHVFSASYSSFLLAPLPAMLVARALGKPVVLNYRSGEAPDHLQRSAIARRTHQPGRQEHRALAFPGRRLPRVRHRRRDHAQHRRSRTVQVPRAASAAAAPGVDAKLRCALQRRDDHPRLQDRAGALAGRDADAGRRRRPGSRPPRARRRARAAPRDVRGPGHARMRSPATTPTTTSTSRARTSTTCRRRCSRRSRAACRSCRRRRAACRRS